MDNKIVVTPSGYSVALKPFLSYSEYQEIQNMMMDGITINAGTQAVDGTVPYSNITKSNKRAVDILIVSITNADGTPFTGKLGDMRVSDASAVMDAIEAIQKEAADSMDKKKLTT